MMEEATQTIGHGEVCSVPVTLGGREANLEVDVNSMQRFIRDRHGV
jgi:hypothetical protein